MKSTFAERLKTVMDFLGVKQAELAESTKIPKSAISQYLSGEFTPRPQRAAVLAKHFGVTEEWLMGYDVPFEIDPTPKFSHLPDLDIFSDEYAKSINDSDCCEKKIMEKYHALDEYGKDMVDTVLEKEYQRCISKKNHDIDNSSYTQNIAAGTGGEGFDDEKIKEVNDFARKIAELENKSE